MLFPSYDVIVVGAGHAGCEAAAAAANMGSKVLLITMNMQTIAQMSCNPAMGGVAKGQIVREIDALGGYSGIVADSSAIQFRMLNKSKGPAMWSPRTQNDRMLFAQHWRKMLENTPNVDFWQDMVVGILESGGMVRGVITGTGIKIHSTSVILTNGTFLNGLIHIGEKQYGGGRSGERAATGITEQLVELGFQTGRMKTGTPPRVDGRSLNYAKMEEQPGDIHPSGFSFTHQVLPDHQRSCYITYTNDAVHNVLASGFDRSPMFNGAIQSTGPRYCPSIEDKINRFKDKDRHQIFVEPEGWDTVEVYVNGFSTSLPEEVQFDALRLVPGFEEVKFFRPGYAIEYDYFPPTQLNSTLETKLIKGLYFAGQINGTTGYEEAACQGMMAGINSVLAQKGKEPFILDRSEAYIGVLIDDLVNKGTEEPYRMFTSRAEFRLLLRQDNADLRLTPKGYALGLIDQKRKDLFDDKVKGIGELKHLFEEISVAPEAVNDLLEQEQTSPLKHAVRLSSLLLRPQLNLNKIEQAYSIPQLSEYPGECKEEAEIQVKYERYIEKEAENAERMQRLEHLLMPAKQEYQELNGLSNEAKEKLANVQPLTLGQASRISGISPADLSVLMVYINK